MKKSVLVIVSAFLYVLLVSSNSFAQSADDYVRSTKFVPNVSDPGWVHETNKDVVNGEFVQESYVNASQSLMALVQVRISNGVREELFMYFGSRNVARAALKVAGVWYVSRGTFHDYTNETPENDIKIVPVNNVQGDVVAIEVTLETLAGFKTIKLLR